MNYPKGIIKQLMDSGINFSHGYDFLYHGEIPNGAGLSSSASIEVVTAYALMTLEQLTINLTELALLAQRTENEFIGVNSGIMDQFIIASGKKGHAMMLMCDTLQYELVPFQTESYKLIISNTNRRRDLVDSKYNERRAQCERAVEQLKTVYPQLTFLGQLTPHQLYDAKDSIKDDIIYNRA